MALNVKITADASQLKREMAAAKRMLGGLWSFASKPLAIGAGVAGLAGGFAITSKAIDALIDSSKKAASMESLQVQFEVLTGSAKTAAAMIKSFREEAAKSPLSGADYANAGKTLMAFGVGAEKTLPILKNLADVSMGNSERFASLALAFAQTQAAGRLMGQEVLQFVNAGFNPLQQISKKTGRSMVELKKAMEDGAISSDMVTQAFKEATSAGGLFYQAIQKGAATTEGKIAKFRDTIDTLKISFGTGMNQGLKVALDAMGSALPQFEAKFAAIGKGLGVAIARAASGDFQIFVKTGVVIGEAIKVGLESTLGNWIVNGALSKIVTAFDPHKGDRERRGLPTAGEQVFGKNLGAAGIASERDAGLVEAVEALKETIKEANETQATGRMRSNEELRKGREATEKLYQAWLRKQPLTAR